MVRVKIKSWKAMEEEFGLDDDEQIRCTFSFVTKMEEIMPEDRIIEVYKSDKSNSWYIWKESDFWISEDMIEAYLD